MFSIFLQCVIGGEFSPEAVACNTPQQLLSLFPEGPDREIAALALDALTQYRLADTGYLFPVEFPLIYDILSKITSSSRVLECGAGMPQLAFLCLLKGAEKVVIIDNSTQFEERCSISLSCLGLLGHQKGFDFSRFSAVLGKMTIKQESYKEGLFPQDVFDIVVLRNFVHLFPQSEQNKMGDLFGQHLTEGGLCYVSTDSSYNPLYCRIRVK